ncbi:conserved hypothetical protein [Leishmania infantum JPCM5]|uniref:Uncharacterized protein n=2 Tax=Leishmania infantum TaxID=5671 RepID=A4HW91_LEIIN|nr:conserved hypothetical protein [Leishmania infantum JPCM5]CAC9470386.1 hypothetical_protein_-_conserved [Leishmania infantum]CAM66714.1 conserved hypothetical protein [Leishmania infantum JPCM5]SUZ40386.1 hypothetical_protein_-_conserved [Leishmania infantum]|eukprot:XP_001464332.1 conserved hypothetical protein [Leishmania infantum JPCM5]
MYAQMPEVYLCPCCSEFSKQEERERLLREARDAKEAERRRLMQLDVFEERARPLPSGDIRRKAYRRIMEDDELAETAPSVPPPPQTIDELRRAKKDQKVPKLIVTVHCGRHVSAEHDDRISVIVRCGAFEGQTEKVLRGKEVMVTWEELFEFPYINHNEPLEVLVVNDALPEKNDQLIGGVMIPCGALHDRSHGDQEPLPIMPEDSMQTGYGSCQEGPLGTIVASWYLRGADDKMDEEAIEQQTLSVPLGCTFVVHHLFQFTDYGAEAYTGGVLCVLRDTDDNCSESVLYKPGAQPEPSLSPYYAKDGYYYLPGNPSQVMQLNTERKLGHILVCVPKKEESSSEEEELLVIGAVPLEFERLYNKGNAVLLIESKSKEDALWGEIEVEWANKPLDDLDPHPSSLAVQKESLFFTIVRGFNLVRRDGGPVAEGYVSVASGELEGVTVEAPATQDSDGNNIISWNQEVRFVEVDPNEKIVEVQVHEKGRLVSVGQCEVDDEEGVVIIQMHHAANINEEAGEVVGSYKRLHAPRPVEEDIYRKRRAAEEAAYKGADEEDEEQEEAHPAAVLDESNVHEDEEEEEEEEEEEPQATRAPPMADRAMSINEDLSEEEKEVDEAAPHETPQWQRSQQGEQEPEEDEEEVPQQLEYLEEAQSEETQPKEELQEDAAQEQQLEPEVEEEPQPEEEEDAEHLVEEALEEVSEPEETEEGLRRPATASEAASESEAGEEGLRRPAAASEEASEAASESEAGEEGLRRPAAASEEASEAASESEAGEEGLGRPAAASEEASEAASESEAGEEGLRRPAAASEEASEAASESEAGEEGLGRPAAASEEASEAVSESEAGEEDLRRPAAAAEEVSQPEEEQPEEEEYHGELHRQEYEPEEAHQVEFGEFEAEHYHAAARSAGTPTAEAGAAYHATAGGRQRRRPSWVSPATKSSGYKQPWYPSGAPETDQHIPFSKTKLSKKNLESIRQLEACKSRIEEESVRRSSTPRRSSTRGLSPSSQ